MSYFQAAMAQQRRRSTFYGKTKHPPYICGRSNRAGGVGSTGHARRRRGRGKIYSFSFWRAITKRHLNYIQLALSLTKYDTSGPACSLRNATRRRGSAFNQQNRYSEKHVVIVDGHRLDEEEDGRMTVSNIFSRRHLWKEMRENCL